MLVSFLPDKLCVQLHTQLECCKFNIRIHGSNKKNIAYYNIWIYVMFREQNMFFPIPHIWPLRNCMKTCPNENFISCAAFLD